MEDKNKYYLYIHKNPNTNQIFYVGIGVRYRYKEIKTNRNQHYLNYVEKYGYPIIEKLHENISYEEACKLEQEYIKKWGRIGYDENGILVNKGIGGEIGARGIKHTNEWKHNHSIIMKEKAQTTEFKERLSKIHKGKKVSKETKQKISISLKPTNEKRINKIKISLSKINRGPAISEGRKKPILQIDKENNIVNVFNSKQEAENITKIKGINNVVIGLAKTAGGFKWKYKDF